MKPPTPDCPVLEPFGLYFRQVISVQPQMAQTTSEPEVTTPDGQHPDKIDAKWIPDEDEEKDEDDKKEEKPEPKK